MSRRVPWPGDLFTHRSYPVIDESSGGSEHGMIEAVDRLLQMIDGDTVLLRGHGAAASRKGLLAFREMLSNVEDHTLALIEAGREIPEIMAGRSTAQYALHLHGAGGNEIPDTMVAPTVKARPSYRLTA
jgi:glyoxylase-like metal-dependent hydrolase (beta-lactamase superfamily II)